MTNVEHDESPQGERPFPLPALTGIRGIAALWVVAFHVERAIVKSGFSMHLPFDAGWTGVDLFFILSGFMLMHAHAHQFRAFSKHNIGQFAISRFLRVYPLSAVVLILILILVLLAPDFATHYARARSGNLSLQSFGLTLLLATRWLPHSGEWNEPVWSLSAEIVGYAAFPLLAFAAGRVRSFRICVLIAITCFTAVLMRQAMTHKLGYNDMSLSGSLFRMGGYFAGGIFLRRAAATRTFTRRTLSSVAICAIIGIVVLAQFSQTYGFLPLTFGLLIFALIEKGGLVAALLSTRPVMFLGRISFPLYLIHSMPILAFSFYAALYHFTNVTYLIGLVLLIAALLLLSLALHACVERPLHMLARRSLPSGGFISEKPGLWLALSVMALSGLIRLRGLGDLVAHADEQFYLLVGQRMTQGAIPYVDIWDRKPPGLFVLYAAIAALPGDDIMGYQIIATVVAALSAACIALWVRRVSGTLVAMISALLYLAMLQVHLGFGGQAEVFVNGLILPAGWLVISMIEPPEPLGMPSARRLALQGVLAMFLAGVAIEIKQTAVFPGVLLGLVLIGLAITHRIPRPRIIALTALWIGAALLPTIVAVAFYAVIGQFDAFLYANLFSIVGKHQTGDGAEQGRRLQLGLRAAISFGPALLVLAWGVIRGDWTRERRGTLFVLAAWFVSGVVAFLILPAGYPHYALLMVPTGCLLVGYAGGVRRLGPVIAVIALILSLWFLRTDAARIAQNGPQSRQIALMANRIADRLNGRCLYVYRGPVVLYSLTGSCLLTRWPFPNHLSTVEEADALGTDPATEVRRILSSRPAVIVDGEQSFHKTNAATKALVQQALRRDYVPIALIRDRSGKILTTAYALRSEDTSRTQTAQP